MRTLVIVILSLFISTNVQSQDKDKAVKTVTIAVKGNCEECKKRIENAADIKGVKFSSWDEDAQAITVTYRPDKARSRSKKPLPAADMMWPALRPIPEFTISCRTAANIVIRPAKKNKLCPSDMFWLWQAY
jgi:hypothetical protein